MHYRIEALVESDRAEEALGLFLEGVLAQHQWHFKVKDLSVYEVTYMPGHRG